MQVHEGAWERSIRPSPDQKTHQFSPAQTAIYKTMNQKQWLLLKLLSRGGFVTQQLKSQVTLPLIAFYISVLERQIQPVCLRVLPASSSAANYAYILSKNRSRSEAHPQGGLPASRGQVLKPLMNFWQTVPFVAD